MKILRSALLAAFLFVPLTSGLAAGPEDAGPARTEPAAPATPDFPTTEATVSLLEPVGEQCEWVRLDPLSAKRRVLARLDAGCQGGSTALSRDGKKGLVRFWRGAVSMPIFGRPTFPEPFPSNKFRDRLFLVDLTTGAVEELPLPSEGELIEYGFDQGGRMLGLSLESGPVIEQQRPRAVELDGAGRQSTIGGKRPAASMTAHAFAFLGGRWLRMESKSSSDGLGTAALEHRKELGERSIRALDPRFEAHEIEDDVVLDPLYELSPEQPEGQWFEFKSGVHRLAVWGTPFGSDVLATGLIRQLEPEKVNALPSYPYRPNDMMSLRTRGPYLLITLADSGAHPRMYKGRKLVWSSETARAVTLWPK
ncbi:hypothetical protein [Hyalangium minutum]|uniref:Lipoprotein n=1 Tax=Hyalangium minutum TaxID=394096 RepID=A0A085WGE3_9BACT|nr:hypothetical protein [Hyalangium minutum]KFE66756.1 hypothetical protein DB31_8970 [Hyalangium minutum]